jgi:hypothetical protein
MRIFTVLFKKCFPILFLFACPNAFSQVVYVLLDGNGAAIGTTPQPSTGSGARVDLNDSGTTTSLSNLTGEAVDFIAPYYLTDDCTGQIYLLGSGSNLSSFIQVLNSNNQPKPLVLVEANAAVQQLEVKSSFRDRCNNSSLGLREFIEANIIEDPSTWGFVLLPGLNQWGFTTPFSIKRVAISQSDGIFCNGFENCPSQ